MTLGMTLTRGSTLPRGIDNATCHTKDLTCGKKNLEKT